MKKFKSTTYSTKNNTKHKGYSPFVRVKALEMYKEGVEVSKICDELGIHSQNVVYSWASRYGYNRQRIRTTQQESLSQQVEENKSLTITIVLEWK